MKNFVIPCWVKVRACEMVVHADNAEEAKEKARKGDYDQIDMDGGEISDWELTGEPKEE